MAVELHWRYQENMLWLSGELTLDSLLPLWRGKKQLMQGVNLIDIGAISRTDSAGLALLLHLAEQVRRQGSSLSIQGASEKLYRLAQLYNLSHTLLPLSGVAPAV